ncbi:AAA family ATPase [Sulfurimonas sp. HSL-1716]|uniref:ATP-dependent DNA helicase n=1 Tax=Hydrocurvibacter sulfurireducens TaxID=3131937 RepID=UPI0031F87239
MKNIVVDHLYNNQNIFLTGGAGVGKTTLVNEIIETFEKDSKKIAKLASTGMAATLINGQTLHSFLEIGICNNLSELEQSSKIKISKKLKNILFGISLIIIDEISMISSSLFDLIRFRLLQAEYKGAVLAVGDFLQLPPVVKGYESVNFAFESQAWAKLNFLTIELTKNHRIDDEDFISLLNRIRFGQLDTSSAEILNSFVKPFTEDLKNFTLLFGKNSSASSHNKRQLSYIDGDLHIKKCEIIKHDDSVTDTQVERYLSDSRVMKELELKIGVPVLFTKNSWNHFNGERGVVVNIDERYVYIRKSDSTIVKLDQSAQHKTIWIEQENEGKKESVEKKLFSVYQYPIVLAFAITIHKSQGMSIKDLIIETNEIFAPSQFYVALSRATSQKRLILIKPKRDWRELVFVDKKAVEFTMENKPRSEILGLL